MVDDIGLETARRIFLPGKVPPGPEAIRRQGLGSSSITVCDFSLVAGQQ